MTEKISRKRKSPTRIPLSTFRRAILGTTGTVLLLGALTCGYRILQPGTSMVEHTDYSYSASAELSYRIKLVPNELYENEYLEEGGLYSTILTDHIEVSINASFAGSAPAETSGTYTVTGVVEGYQDTKDSKRVIYERRYPLKDGMAAKEGSGNAVIHDVIYLDMAPYRQSADQADIILGAAPARRFYLLFEGIFKTATEYGTAEEPFSLQLQIPIQSQGGLFEILKQNPLNKTGQLTSQTEVTIPVNPVIAVLTGVWAAASLGLILWILLGTRRPNEEETYNYQAKALLRKYGSRMICLSQADSRVLSRGIEVSDVDALMLIAEEIHRPVCYSLDENGLPRDGMLYVPEGERCYIFRQKRPAVPNTTLEVDEKEKRSTGDDGKQYNEAPDVSDKREPGRD